MTTRSIENAMPGSMKRTNDFLFDYLAEFSGADDLGPASDRHEGERQDDLVITVQTPAFNAREGWPSYQPISARKRLAATITVSRDASSKLVRPKSESLLVLLQCLHFLNQPISESLRRSFLAAAEQSIEDYQCAEWESAVTSCSGVPSETA